MTNQEAIEAIKLAQSQVEWDYPMDYAAAFDKAIEALEQEPVIRDNGVKNELEPTTKNDLAVDCISRKAAEDITWQDPSYTDPLNILTEVRDKIRELPSVTLQEPKTGHWIAYEVRLPDRTILNYRCSVCGRKLIGYNTETLSEAPFCHCGAKMVEPQESEVMGNANGNN